MLKNKYSKVIAGLIFGASLSGLIIYYFTVKNNILNGRDGRVYYEIFVREFSDSNGDGIGDINGVINNLDYLKDLGVGGIILLPIQKSNSYYGYDITEHKEIKEEYGTIDDFENLIKEAKKRDIKVNLSLVLNNTSDKHKWFEEAKKDEKNKYRDYYIWKDNEEKLKDFNQSIVSPSIKFAWRELNEKDKYYATWSECMPDINLTNEDVKNEIKDIAKFYIDKGIDGFKLEGVKWYFNYYEENTKFIEEFSSYCKDLKNDFIIMGDVREGQVYMKNYTDVLDNFLYVNLSDFIKDGLLTENIDRLSKTLEIHYNELNKLNNKNFKISPVLNNNYEDRFINKLGNSEEKMKMAGAIYLTLPGNPVIYYGEEIGLLGEGVVENKNGGELLEFTNKGLCEDIIIYDKSKLIDKKISPNDLEKNKSIYEFYKKLLNAREENISLKTGTVSYKNSNNKSVMVMKRKAKNEVSYVIVNSSENPANIKLPIGNYKVTLSNKRDTKSEHITKDIQIKGEEVLILTK